MLHCSQPAVACWETGLRRPRPEMSEKLEKIFGQSAAVLLAPADEVVA